jgi:Beta-propeller repeat
MSPRSVRRLLPAIMILFVALIPSPGKYFSSAGAVAPAGAVGREQAYERLPLAFAPEIGPDGTRFLARGDSFTLSLEARGATLVMRGQAHPAPSLGSRAMLAPSPTPSSSTVRFHFLGANAHPTMLGLHRLPGVLNEFVGNNPTAWRTDVPTYAKVEYSNVYPGINLVFYSKAGKLEYDWVVKPGADTGKMVLAISGPGTLQLNRRGDLVMGNSGHRFVQTRPVMYQTMSGARRPIVGQYALSGGRVSIRLGAFDHSRPLTIDPTILYASYLGGPGEGIAVDGAGDAYVTGDANCDSIPAIHAVQPRHSADCSNSDVFVQKLNPAGNELLYSTYLGGNGPHYAAGIAVDSTGNAYITGYADAPDFPIVNALQPEIGTQTGFNAYVAKLDPNGDRLIFSTYLGGSADTEGHGIAVDSQGNVYVTGTTRTSGFPLKNALQTGKGKENTAFVSKISPDGSALVYSTLLGGSTYESGNSIAVDKSGATYVTGETDSTDFPTAHAFQASYAGTSATSTGGGDAFVSKLNPSGSALDYSTYLGGNSGDRGLGIAIDDAGSAYVTGLTASPNFPLAHPLQKAMGAGVCTDCAAMFVSKLDPSGSSLIYSTYLGSGDDEPHGIAVNTAGEAYVVGVTRSTSFPTMNAVQPKQGAGGGGINATLSKIDAAGDAFVFSTYLGGSNEDNGFGIAVDAAGSAYVTGFNTSSDFPTVNALPAFGSDTPGFVAKIGDSVSTLPIATPVAEATLPPATAGHPTPIATAIPTLGPNPNADALWNASVAAMAVVQDVHARGTITDGRKPNKSTVSFTAECGSNAVRFQLQGKQKKQTATVQVILIGNRAWSRGRTGNAHWSAWTELTGDNVLAVVLLLPSMCPQGSLSIVGPGGGGWKNLGASTVDGMRVTHLHIQAAQQSGRFSADVYLAAGTHYWIRLSRAQSDKTTASTSDAHFSRYGKHVTINPPIKAESVSTTGRRVPLMSIEAVIGSPAVSRVERHR